MLDFICISFAELKGTGHNAYILACAIFVEFALSSNNTLPIIYYKLNSLRVQCTKIRPPPLAMLILP